MGFNVMSICLSVQTFKFYLISTSLGQEAALQLDTYIFLPLFCLFVRSDRDGHDFSSPNPDPKTVVQILLDSKNIFSVHFCFVVSFCAEYFHGNFNRNLGQAATRLTAGFHINLLDRISFLTLPFLRKQVLLFKCFQKKHFQA